MQVKIGLTDPLIYPKHSFLNPEFTTTVPVEQTAYGVVDTIAHAIEAWFGTECQILLKVCILDYHRNHALWTSSYS